MQTWAWCEWTFELKASIAVCITKWHVTINDWDCQVYIITEVSLLSSHMAMPQKGHLDAVLHVFGYLKQKYNLWMGFDPNDLCCDKRAIKECTRSSFTLIWQRLFQAMHPIHLGRVCTCKYVDNNHAWEKKIRKSCSGFYGFINSALVQWLLKEQATIKT